MAIDSKVYEPSVVVSSKRHAEGMQWRPTLLVLSLGIAIGVAGTLSAFKLINGSLASSSTTVEKADVKSDVKKLRFYYEEKLAALEAESALNSATIESMQSMVAQEEKEKLSLKADLSFYKSLMNVENGKKGISLQTIHIEKLGSDQLNHRFRYKMVVQQKVLRHNLVTGKLRADIVARQMGKEVIYPLSTIKREVVKGELDSVAVNSLHLRFKYFQILEGEFVLPKSVTPELVVINIAISKPKKLTIEEHLTWSASLLSAH